MKHFWIITNMHKDPERKLTDALAEYICKKGGTCHSYMCKGEAAISVAPQLEEIGEETDCVMVLGGDGTLIRAAARLVDSRIPLIGVNLGTLGYLCELEEGNVFEAIDRLMAGDYMIEKRMMLEGHGVKGGEEVGSGIAFNDIVLHRASSVSIVCLSVYINGEYLHTFRGDGIIISTPTGSTGYNMSAGGPIVDPKAQMMLITPINPHTLNARSIVIAADDEVVIQLDYRRAQRDEMVEVSFDGDNVVKLDVEDRVVIRKAKETARICKLSNESFLQILGKKMQAYT